MSSREIVYLHGFASSGASGTVEILRREFLGATARCCRLCRTTSSSPRPLAAGAKRPPEWDEILHENAGAVCTFPYAS